MFVHPLSPYLAFAVICFSAGAFSEELPPRGVLANEEAAVKVAESILVGVYGEKVLQQKPFRAKLDGEFWIIEGTLHCLKGSICKGGVATIELNKRDSQVRKVTHGK